jgi:transposase
MSEDYQRIEVITGTARRRRWSTEEKLRIVEETLQPGASISAVARRNGVAPNLLYRWRRLMTEGSAIAVQADDGVTGNAEVRRLEARVRELERQLGRKTLEVEVLKEALDRSRVKKPSLLMASPPPGGSR